MNGDVDKLVDAVIPVSKRIVHGFTNQAFRVFKNGSAAFFGTYTRCNIGENKSDAAFQQWNDIILKNFFIAGNLNGTGNKSINLTTAFHKIIKVSAANKHAE